MVSVRATVLLVLACVGCKSAVDDGYAIDVTVLVDPSVPPADAARIATLDVEVSGAESFSHSIPVAGKLGGSAGLRYKPVARSGTIDFVFTAADDNGVTIAAGNLAGVTLRPGVTQLETVRLVAVSPSEDMSSALDLATVPDVGSPDLEPAPDDLTIVYTSSSIAAMRQGSSGRFELANVVSVGVSHLTKSYWLYVQDAAGGDYSAMNANCFAASTTHPCSVSVPVLDSIVDGSSLTLRGSYFKNGTTGAESFYLEELMVSGSGVMPPTATATLAQIQRGATNRRLWFQRVVVDVPVADRLRMFDFTPPELTISAAVTVCPFVLGFGMLPISATGTATAVCSNGTSQPSGQTTVNSAEILVSTEFFKGFDISTDCRCAKTNHQNEPTSMSEVSGTITAILVGYGPFGPGGPYQYLAPKTVADFNVSNTIPGM